MWMWLRRVTSIGLAVAGVLAGAFAYACFYGAWLLRQRPDSYSYSVEIGILGQRDGRPGVWTAVGAVASLVALTLLAVPARRIARWAATRRRRDGG